MALAVLSVVLREGRGSWRPATFVASRPWIPWAVAGAAFALLVATVDPQPIGGPRASNVDYLLINVCSAVVAIFLLVPTVIGADGGGALRRMLSLRVLAWLGLISYGIFLWHHTPMAWMVDRGVLDWVPGSGFLVLTLMTLAFALVAASISYYVVERPILRFKDRRRRAD